MSTHYPPTQVRQLMADLAEEDAQELAVNIVLYHRSAVYQRTLDGHLAARGCYVSGQGGVLRVRAARSGLFASRDAVAPSGPCTGGGLRAVTALAALAAAGC
jgi:hypothetical protein